MNAIIRSPQIIIWAASFLKLTLFDIIWCAGTTFRAFSDPLLYLILITVSAIIALPYILTRKLWIQIMIFTVLDMLLISNLMYCRTYFTAIPLESYLFAGNLSDFLPSVADSLRISDILLPLSTIAALFTVQRYGDRVHNPNSSKTIIYAAIGGGNLHIINKLHHERI